MTTSLFSLITQGTETTENSKRRKLSSFDPLGEPEVAGPSESKTPTFIRSVNSIHVKGDNVPDPITTFKEITNWKNISSSVDLLLENIQKYHFEKPTPIQMQSISVLTDNREIMACAPTGSGKTLAFLIPLFIRLQKPKPKTSSVRSVILCPTKELAAQIHRDALLLANGAKWKICLLSKANSSRFSVSTEKDVHSTKKKFRGVDILITSPMRLVHLLSKQGINLNKVEYIILDEADKLFHDQFLEQIDKIFHACSHPGIVRGLFSATLTEQVESLARSLLNDPIRVIIGIRGTAAKHIDQQLIYVTSETGKLMELRKMIKTGIKPPVLIFLSTKQRATRLMQELLYDSISCDCIHSDRTPAQRNNTVQQFRGGKLFILIATDIIARGMDFKGVNTVINYDFPKTPIEYIHRIGRTGRAGRRGNAITYYTDQDLSSLKPIAKIVKSSGGDVPKWISQANPYSLKRKAIKSQHHGSQNDGSTSTKSSSGSSSTSEHATKPTHSQKRKSRSKAKFQKHPTSVRQKRKRQP